MTWNIERALFKEQGLQRKDHDIHTMSQDQPFKARLLWQFEHLLGIAVACEKAVHLCDVGHMRCETDKLVAEMTGQYTRREMGWRLRMEAF